VSQATVDRVMAELERQRLTRQQELQAAQRRSTQRIIRAVNAAYRARNCVWVPELGPCNVAERAFVRKVVAQRITYEAAMGAWYTPTPWSAS
jgi:hypothetical protein